MQSDLELFDIVPGEYTASVWGFDAMSIPVAFGCSDGVLITSGEYTSIDITLTPF